MRSFVALELPEPVRESLARLGAEIRSSSAGWAGEKWVAPANLHVTLKFMGELSADQLSSLVEGMRPALAAVEPAPFFFNSVAAHPANRRAAMLWAVPGYETSQIRRIAEAVDAQTALLGVPVEERRFRAHVTLVRARRPRPAPRAMLDAAWAAVYGTAPGSTTGLTCPEAAGKAPERFVSGSAVTVYTSTLTRTGPVYDTFARIPVG